MSRIRIAAYRAIRAAGRSIGLEIRRSGPATREDLRLVRFMRNQQIDLLLDIGANRGQFAQNIMAAGYQGRIVSFEPMPDVHEILERQARVIDRWEVSPPVAISDQTATAEFHINSADASSSLLPAAEASSAAIAELAPSHVIQVPTVRLDDIADDYGIGLRRSLIKIDVQGGEAKVLAGADATLDQAVGLHIEMSLSELYQGLILAPELLGQLTARGFELFDIGVAYRDPSSFRLHQIDVTMFHRDRLIRSAS